MAVIDSDDPTLAKRLRDHVDLLEAAGGWVNPELIIRSTGGEISLCHDGDISAETRLVWVPSDALISIEHGMLGRNRDEIIPGTAAVTLQPRQRRILEVQCDIFNLTEKLAKARNLLPRLALDNAPELLDSLQSRRVHPKEETHPQPVVSPSSQPDGLMSAFLGTRLLRPRTVGARDNILMSLIDYLNHHRQAERYHFRQEDRSLFVVPWRVNDRGGECFVRYNEADAHGFYLNYGFIDTSATFAWAASFEITVEDLGIIQLNGGRSKRQVASGTEKNADRTSPGPALDILPNGDLWLSNLAISCVPGSRTLRKNLAIALLSWKRHLPQKTMTRLVDMLEWEAVHRTLAYYDHLAETAIRYPDLPASADVVRLADLQRQILHGYQRGLSRKQPS